MFASKGYVVIAPNPTGSTGYGQQFTNDVSKDWGGRPYEDLMKVYDYSLKNFKFIDSKNTFAAGASFGGYMINWIEDIQTVLMRLFLTTVSLIRKVCGELPKNSGSLNGNSTELPGKTESCMKNGILQGLFKMLKRLC